MRGYVGIILLGMALVGMVQAHGSPFTRDKLTKTQAVAVAQLKKLVWNENVPEMGLKTDHYLAMVFHLVDFNVDSALSLFREILEIKRKMARDNRMAILKKKPGYIRVRIPFSSKRFDRKDNPEFLRLMDYWKVKKSLNQAGEKIAAQLVSKVVRDHYLDTLRKNLRRVVNNLVKGQHILYALNYQHRLKSRATPAGSLKL